MVRVYPLRVLTVLLIAAALPSTASASGCRQGGRLPCGVVAAVGDQRITRAEYDHLFAVMSRLEGGTVVPDPPRFRRCVAAKLEEAPPGVTRRQLRRQCAGGAQAARQDAMQLLIQFTWIRGEAAEEGITVTPAEIRQGLRTARAISFRSHRAYRRFLRRTGQTKADILLRVQLTVLSNKLRDRVKSQVAPVTDEDVERYYRRNHRSFVTRERRDLRVIRTRTRAQAAAARARLAAGRSWSSVARAVSDMRHSRLADVTRGETEPRLDHAAKFADAFVGRWRARTICRRGYRTSDCANGP